MCSLPRCLRGTAGSSPATGLNGPPCKPGRPQTGRELRRLVLGLDSENQTWGYRRIHGEILGLGHKIAATTVWKILRDAGREPRPARSGPSWSDFIRSQAKAGIATDFFTVDIAWCHDSTCFFIEMDTRIVHLVGITTNPSGPWTTQQARNLLMRLERTVRFVLHDGGGQYTRNLDDVFTGIGAEAITTPPAAPRAKVLAS